MKIIGRKPELALLSETLDSDKPELVAIYGRRRVGKTFLIREHYKSNFVFEVTGLSKGSLSDQIENFTKEIRKRTSDLTIKTPRKWVVAFTLLEQYIESLSTKKKKVIFIDEFPWMATPRSKFLMAFENFWNHFASKRNDLIVVVCGSAASFMVQKIIKNKGGLHNRITKKIRLLPFNLNETELFLKNKGINYTHYDILQLYMAIGGIPHYLESLKKGDSVTQNIDRICFEKDGVLNDEFYQLFSSLFEDSEKHLAIITALASTRKGISRGELVIKSKVPSGGDFSLKLNELIESGFVSEYNYYQNKKKLSLYRLSDEYSLFFLKFIDKNKAAGPGTWQNLFTSQSYKSWLGFSFETLCLKHIGQIKKGLRIDAIYSINSSWFNDNAQIDLLIDRNDNVINICELKFYNSQFTIDKNYHANLRNKIIEFQKETKTNKNIFLTMVTTFGVNQNQYSTEIMENELTMECLFIE
jgi:hypothetical protein